MRQDAGATVSDGEIAERVEQALLGDNVLHQCGIGRHLGAVLCALRPAAHASWWIELRVENGIVTLDGNVPSLAHKRLAGALAWWAPGTRDVVNGLGIDTDELDSDQEILDGLRLVLEKDPLIDQSQLQASCEGSVVTLDGVVATEQQRSAAEFDARALFGVDDVVNRIEVRPSSA